MRLSKLAEFRRLFYTPGSAHSMSTLRKRIQDIPGGTVMLGHYYVDLDEFDRATNLRARLAAEMAELEKHPLLKGLI